MTKVPQQMSEQEYVEAYRNLPGLNETYVRAIYRHVHRQIDYNALLNAYHTTEAHKKEVRLKKPWEIKTKS